MNNVFEENRKALFMLVGSLFVLLIVLYFVLISPLIVDLKGMRVSQIELEDDISILEAKLQQLDESEEELEQKQLELQKKVPLSRELDEIILMLQEVELQSTSLIKKIEFGYNHNLPSSDHFGNLDTDGEEEGREDANKVEERNDEISVAMDLSKKPERLEIVTIAMEITSPSYDGFLQFLTEIESQTRLMGVSSLEFKKSTETEPSETITHQVELVTFYYQE